MGDRILISVLIVTYNNANTIGNCIDSLYAQNFPSLEILVRDNDSSDSTVEVVNALGDVNLFACKENIGFGAAMNYLAERAVGEYLFILNPDCICPENSLQQLYDFAKSHPGAVSPALVYPDGTPQPSSRELPTYSSIIFSRRSPLYILGLARTKSAGYLRPENNVKVPAVSATALLINRQIFSDIGGFDQRFFMYGEDLDLCKRLGNGGHDIWFMPGIELKHILGESSKSVSLRTSYNHHISIYKYFRKHHPDRFFSNLFLGILLTGGFCFSVLLKIMGIKRRK